jgi:hypothetical protein
MWRLTLTMAQMGMPTKNSKNAISATMPWGRTVAIDIAAS